MLALLLAAALRIWVADESEKVRPDATPPTAPGPVRIHLAAGKYSVQSGRYGWAETDPILDLYRFLPD